MLGVGMFSSFWAPLALAEVTTYLHFIMRSSNASHEAQLFKKHVDNALIALCIIANIIRNALWVAYIENYITWNTVWAFQHFYLGVEWTIILNIGCTAMQLNLAEYQHQGKVDISLPDLSTCLLSPMTRRFSQCSVFWSPRCAFARSSCWSTTMWVCP